MLLANLTLTANCLAARCDGQGFLRLAGEVCLERKMPSIWKTDWVHSIRFIPNIIPTYIFKFLLKSYHIDLT